MMLKLQGPNAMKYLIWFGIMRIVLHIIFIIYVLIPYGKQFLLILQNSLNDKKWDLLILFIPLLKIIGFFILIHLIILLISIIFFNIYVNKYIKN